MLAQFSTELQSQHLDSQLQVDLSRYTYPFMRHGDALPERAAGRQQLRALVPGSALGVLPVTDDLEKLDVGEVGSWANAVSPRGAVLAIVGAVEPTAALAAARTWLSGWSGREPVALPEAALPAPGAPVVTARPGASQVHLRWACRVPAQTPRARLAAEVLAERLDEVANDLLREQAGATADAETTATVWRGGTAWVEVSAFIDADRFPASVADLERAFGSLRPADGLERARLGAARTLAQAQATAPSLAKFLSTRLARGASLAEVTDPVGQLGQVTEADLGAALAQCRATVVESRVGDFSAP
jgi:predicted Zn-dependent peptidase